MKRTGLGQIASFNFNWMFCLIVLALMAIGAAAQQEVDPEHFDQPPGKAQSRTVVPHQKRVKNAQKRRARKPTTATAKSDAPNANQKSASTPQVIR